MVSIRQVAALVWAVTVFMLAAALALSLRYKSLGESSTVVDTWTGRLRTAGEAPELARSSRCTDRIVSIEARRAGSSQLRVQLERFRHVELTEPDCKGVCFAFPAR